MTPDNKVHSGYAPIDLDAWEADAKENKYWSPHELHSRILALISRLKSAEEVLKSLDPMHAVAHFEKYASDEGEKGMMEMPEGWKNLDRITNEPISRGQCTGWLKRDARKYLDLLKEMAEATEEMVTACKQGYARDISKMERALQKFKEWK